MLSEEYRGLELRGECQLISGAQRALGFEAEIETGVVLGDGNTYTKAALTNDGMHIDYWVRLAGDTIVYDMAIYSESDKGLADTAMAAVKPY